MNSISIKQLSIKIDSNEIIHSINFNVPQKSICAFIGHNGAGKTTTIKCMLNLYPTYTGVISLLEKNNKIVINENKVGYVPEKENFPKKKVINFLLLMCKLSKMSKDNIEFKINYYLRKFNAENLKNLYLNKISSGQKKKIMVIQALLHDPDILIMDEPTENMDPDTRTIFYDVIKQLRKDGKTIFISTHQLDEIKNVIDYVIIIKNGFIKYSNKFEKNINLNNLYKNI